MQGNEIESQTGKHTEYQAWKLGKTDRHTEHGRYRRSGRNSKNSRKHLRDRTDINQQTETKRNHVLRKHPDTNSKLYRHFSRENRTDLNFKKGYIYTDRGIKRQKYKNPPE